MKVRGGILCRVWTRSPKTNGSFLVIALLGLAFPGCGNRDPSPSERSGAQPPDTIRSGSPPERVDSDSDVASPGPPPSIPLAVCRRCVAVGLSRRGPDGNVFVVGRIDSSGSFDRLFAPGLGWRRIRRGTYLVGDSIRWIAKGGDTLELHHKQDPTEDCVRTYRMKRGWIVTNARSEAVALEAAPSLARRIDSLLRLGPSFAYTVQGFNATLDPDACDYVPGAVDRILEEAAAGLRKP